MDCPKCGTTVAANAAECPGCGVVLAKAADAMDRAFLRRQTLARQKAAAPPPPEPKSPWRVILIVAALALCAFGAWQWYTDDKTSDLESLAAEIKNSDGSARDLDGGRTERRTWRLAAKFGIALALFAAGYLRLKRSLSP
jgi:hypothetical protein